MDEDIKKHWEAFITNVPVERFVREVMLDRELDDDAFPKIHFPGDKVPPHIGWSGEEV